MIEKLKEIKQRYLEVERLLSLPESVLDMTLYKRLSKEYKDLGKIVSVYEGFSLVLLSIEDACSVVSNEKDDEFKELAKIELEDLYNKKTEESSTKTSEKEKSSIFKIFFCVKILFLCI